MLITTEHMHRALMVFLEEEIAGKATGIGKFAAFFLLGSLNDHPEKTVGLLLDNPLVKMTDVVTPDNMIKADELYRVARMAMEKAQSITLAGITFNVQDIDHIFNIIQRG